MACARCAVSAEGCDGTEVPLGWSLTATEGGPAALCERCTREHVRDIEAKLDETWWT